MVGLRKVGRRLMGREINANGCNEARMGEFEDR